MERSEVLERLAPMRHLRVVNVERGAARVEATDEGLVMRPGRGRPLTVTADATPKVFKFAGLQQNTAESLSRRTLGAAATELLAAKGRYVLFTRDGEVVDITPPGALVPVDPERVVRAVERALPDVEYTRVLTPRANEAQIELAAGEPLMVVETTPRESRHLGDLVRGGAMLTFSTFGTNAPEVQSFVVRLVCTNGLLATDVIRTYRLGGDGDDLYGFFRTSVREAYRAAGAIVERFRAMAGREIAPDQRAHILEGLLRKAHISGRDAMAVHAAAEENPPTNEWEAYNLVTWATSHVIEEPARVIRAQRALAPVVAPDAQAVRPVCPACGHAH